MTIEIKPILTEATYEAALAEVERLCGALPGSPQGDLLDALNNAIFDYEDEHFPPTRLSRNQQA